MGYETYYSGEVVLSNKKMYDIVKKLSDDGLEPFNFSFNFNDEKLELSIGDGWKDYDDDFMKCISFIAQLDNKAEGEFKAEGEDRDDNRLITICNGKVKFSDGEIVYGKEEEFVYNEVADLLYQATGKKKYRDIAMLEKI
jgi:hypothetical protein